MHTPVLLQQAIESLNVKKNGLYVDATFGEGGYTNEILKRGGRVLAIDLDADQLGRSQISNKNLVLKEGNFARIEEIARKADFFPVDGVVFDLGLSMGQLDFGERGLSYNKLSEALDMRIGGKGDLTAEELINGSTEEELYEILAHNSEELKSKEIAKEIKSRKKVRTVSDLVSAIDKAAGFKSRTIYARIFQALRIEVNREFDNLRKGLTGAAHILKKDGKIVVVSFHSLEDRIVKNFGKSQGLRFKVGRVSAGPEARSFERSAKIRILQQYE